MKKKKTKTIKYGKIPINCSSKIIYRDGKKPIIKFGYPDKKGQKSLIYMNPYALLTTLAFFLFIFLMTVWFFPSWYHSPDISYKEWDCNISKNYFEAYWWINLSDSLQENKYIKNNFTLVEGLKNASINIKKLNGTFYGFEVACFNQNNSQVEKYNITFYRGGGNLPIIGTRPHFSSNQKYLTDYAAKYMEFNAKLSLPFRILLGIGVSILFIICYFGFLVGVYYLTYFFGWALQQTGLTRNYVNKNIPILNKKLSTVKYMATIKEVPKNKIIELPLFKNVFLDYEATGDFSKQLEMIEVNPHSFNEVSKQWKKGKRKLKKKKNIWLWNAKFHFKRVPKNGKIELRWK